MLCVLKRVITIKKNLINAAIDNLSGEESLYGEDSGGEGKLEEIAFLVKHVAKFLNMPTNNLQVAAEVVKKLDQVGLIRRLVQKVNMQMRLVTLNTMTGLVGKFFMIQPQIENLRPILEETPEIADDKPDADVLSGAIEISHLTSPIQTIRPMLSMI